jgi:hypothetical protein
MLSLVFAYKPLQNTVVLAQLQWNRLHLIGEILHCSTKSHPSYVTHPPQLHRRSEMDIYPASAPNWVPPEVPYLIDKPRRYVFDNQQFFKFPARMGWADVELGQVNNGGELADQEKTPQNAAALTQAWLFFGIIYHVTRVPVQTREFVTESAVTQRQVITLKPLLGIIAEWKKWVTAADMDERTAYINEVEESLEPIGATFTTCIGFSNSVIPSDVSLSILMLFRVLMLAKKTLFPNTTIPAEHFFGDWNERLKSALARLGWCKDDIPRLSTRLSSIHMFCLGAMGAWLSVRDHSMCTEGQCRSLKHQMRHAGPSCGCDIVGPMEETVTSLVNDGRLPLLVVNSQGRVKIQAIPATSESPVVPYIAISHLCADGLGDPDQNTMFRCQLRQLQSRVDLVMHKLLLPYGLVDELRPFPFWIDTICVPGHPGPAKDSSMGNMKGIYERAVAVLVIDRELDQVEASLTRLEKALMIATSLWWTRMWTLQEGVFARHLFFQLGQEPITLDTLARICEADETPVGANNPTGTGSIKSLLTGDLVRSLSLQNFGNAVIGMTQGRSLFQYMGGRYVSRAEDEALCLAILLGKNAKLISAMPPDPGQRIKKLILMQRTFPSFLLFNWDVEQNIDEPGFRWAPKTFLGRGSLLPAPFSMRHTNEISVDGVRDIYGHSMWDDTWADDAGLHTTYPGFRIETSQWATHRGGAKPIQAAGGNNMLGIHVDLPEVIARWKVHLVTNADTKEPAQTWSTFLDDGGAKPSSTTIAIILPRIPQGAGHHLISVGRLVSIDKEEQEVARTASEQTKTGDQRAHPVGILQNASTLFTSILAVVLVVFTGVERRGGSSSAGLIVSAQQQQQQHRLQQQERADQAQAQSEGQYQDGYGKVQGQQLPAALQITLPQRLAQSNSLPATALPTSQKWCVG